MKVLIATGLYAPEIGGPATYTAFLEKHLPDLAIDFTVVPFRDVRRYPKFVRHVAYFFLLILRGRGADIIYALDTISVGLPAMCASVLLRKPLYLRVPGDYAWEQGQQRFGITKTLDEYLVDRHKPFFVRMLALIQQSVARHATRIIVPSDYLKRVVVAWGVRDEKKITRIYSALKVIDVPQTKEALRTELGYAGFVVVTAARLVPWKGIPALIDAIVLLHKKGVPASLRVIGDGTDRAMLEEYARTSLRGQTGARDVIQFLGALPREVLGKHLKAADAFVLNTSYEGLSHQLIEVMSLGTPIVTTPVGGNVELIEDGVSGRFVAFNETSGIAQSLEDLYMNPLHGAKLAQMASQKVNNFHEDVIVREVSRLFV